MDSLLDRIYAELAEADREWTAEELGRSYLKLTLGGAQSESLLRRLLGRDRRFVESTPGRWRVERSAPEALQDAQYLLAWIETAQDRGPRYRVHCAPFDRAGRAAAPVLLDTGEPESWGAAAARFTGLRWVAWQAPLLTRVARWMERRAAVPELEAPIDLLAWARCALVLEGVPTDEAREASDLPALLARWSLGPASGDEVPLPALAAILDSLLERFGHWTDAELVTAQESRLGLRPVDWRGFSFTRAEIDALPSGSGVYRFYDREDALLYVGKAARLDRRVSSYFRALPPERSKREELLERVVRLEIEPTPTELDALVREAEEIRQRAPRWNVQVQVHPPDRYPDDWFWPLLFVAPGFDERRASLFVLESPSLGWWRRVPRDPAGEELESLANELAPLLRAGTQTLARAHTGASGPLEAPEIALALRYYLRHRDQISRLDLPAHPSAELLAEACFALASEGRDRAADPAADELPA